MVKYKIRQARNKMQVKRLKPSPEGTGLPYLRQPLEVPLGIATRSDSDSPVFWANLRHDFSLLFYFGYRKNRSLTFSATILKQVVLLVYKNYCKKTVLLVLKSISTLFWYNLA